MTRSNAPLCSSEAELCAAFTVTGENILAGSQKKSSLSPAEGLQGASPDATCTCPSGDGSLRHPCPAHPAVEQAGGDERAAFEAAYQTEHAGFMGPLKLERREDGEYKSEHVGSAWRMWQARAALEQLSPAPELVERGTQHRFSTTEQTCRHDFAGVWWNDNGETKTGRECRHCGFFVADVTEAPAEQAERPERPEVVAFIHERTGAVANADMVRAMEEGSVPSGYTIGLMTVAQHERIVAFRWERAMDLMGEQEGSCHFTT